MTRHAGAWLIVLACLTAACAGPGSKVNSRSAAEANAELGLAYLEQGQDERAMEKLKHALSLDPNLASAHHYIAELYQKIGDDQNAERHYRKALSLTPSEPMLLNNYGVFLCKNQRLADAESQFLAAAKQPFYKTPEMAYTNAALCALEKPDPAKAEDYLRTALRLDPRMAQALYTMAELKLDQQEYLSARAFLQRYFEVASASPQSLWLAVQVERQLGDTAAAAQYAQRLQKEFPLAHETELMRGQ